jgi:hypothetical protein
MIGNDSEQVKEYVCVIIFTKKLVEDCAEIYQMSFVFKEIKWFCMIDFPYWAETSVGRIYIHFSRVCSIWKKSVKEPSMKSYQTIWHNIE